MHRSEKTHGLQRTNADKRKAVLGMLADFADWSDRAIARHVGVGHTLVSDTRKGHLAENPDAPAIRTIERAGKTYTQDTSGQKKANKERAAKAPKVETVSSPEVDPPAASASGGPKSTAPRTLLDERTLRPMESAPKPPTPNRHTLLFERLRPEEAALDPRDRPAGASEGRADYASSALRVGCMTPPNLWRHVGP